MMQRVKNPRRGNAVMEAALVLPILIMLSFGGVQYGYYFYVKNTMQGAARAGARAAIVPGATAAEVDAAIASAMSVAGFAPGKYSKSYTNISVDSGQSVQVNVTATWGTIGFQCLPASFGGLATSKQLSTAATMMKE